MGIIQNAIAEGTRDVIFKYLVEEGYRPTLLDDPTSLSVKVEGGFYLVYFDPSDKGFYQVTFPHMWVETSEHNYPAIERACNHANVSTKLAKCFRIDNAVHCSVQSMADTPAEFVARFQRYLSALKFTMNDFVTFMKSPG